jgi:serine/threonine protein kinase
VLKLLRDVCQGLSEVHSKGLIHFDLKPENIFVSNNNEAFLGDFGLCSSTHDCSLFENEGDSRYLDPNIFSGLSSLRSDIYSLGIMGLEIFEILELNQYEVLKDLFTKCTKPNEQERPSLSDVIETINKLINICYFSIFDVLRLLLLISLFISCFGLRDP